jgi:hypothetical protein
MKKIGFVYIWMDLKYQRFYIGSHWGTLNDGYVCSSRSMKFNYLKRPHTFKRRILETTKDRNSLLEREYKWLSKIPRVELGKKYYNLYSNYSKFHKQFVPNIKLSRCPIYSSPEKLQNVMLGRRRGGDKAFEKKAGVFALSKEQQNFNACKGARRVAQLMRHPEYRKLHAMKSRYGRLKKRFDRRVFLEDQW